MTNENFKQSLADLGMNKKEFAEKVGVAHQTVMGWTNQGYPQWVDVVIELMTELSQHTKLTPLEERVSLLEETVNNLKELK